MGILGGIGKLFGGGGGGGLFGALGKIGGLFKGIMNSPLGAIIGTVFPPAGMAMGAMNLVGMLGDLGTNVGGAQNY